ncbi:protein kinase domain protein [Ichthyophthirius multifiliis]|uniref:Protein kinase domain protein n=1 Tax=Ichthyophthirius multifiliis TaxID=5932 RepID=G0QVJ3_ICHMU|nr:protein kinase domain protein [Ichthyophthirius multifiliis]EGR30753.1 protein kinase domain protein [Ichthyophthirius multifiliis]|eukprot:XP_004032340.1 protein kinase domain protein [Ichthyophthirius multifiliis]
MVLISFTNIVVDEFSYGKKKEKRNQYLYFLTHMHSANKLKNRSLLRIDAQMGLWPNLLF